MKKLLSSVLAYRMIQAALGAVFLYSGGVKSLDPGAFAEVIHAFGILPSGLVFPAAIVIVALELLLGAGLVMDIRGSLAGICVLLLGFMAVAGYAILMGYDIDCGCFGPSDPEARAFSGLRTVLVRDTLMMGVIAGLYGWRWYNTHRPRRLFIYNPIKLMKE